VLAADDQLPNAEPFKKRLIALRRELANVSEIGRAVFTQPPPTDGSETGASGIYGGVYS
jgi:hypothetical protein